MWGRALVCAALAAATVVVAPAWAAFAAGGSEGGGVPPGSAAPVSSEAVSGIAPGTAAGRSMACGEPLPAAAASDTSAGPGQVWASLLRGVLGVAPSISPDDRLLILDLRRRRITLYVKGKQTKQYPIAVGTRENPSPVGEFRVVHKDRDWGGGFGARWMGLNVPWGIYGIHGTNNPGSIGSSASHGCFRMFNRNVIDLFPEVPVGTPVHIIGPFPKYFPRNVFKEGASGKDVVVFQFRLREAGFVIPEANGRFQKASVDAVKAAQAFFGLPVDGQGGLDLQWLVGLRHEGESGQ